MHLTKSCPDFPAEKFKDGITNGANWYIVSGGMQDFNYIHSNCFEITIEMGCTKFPKAATLQSYWDAHKLSMILFMTQVHNGVRGFVMSDDGKPLKRAVITVSGINHMVFTADDGDYWRLLVPGTYNIKASADGYSSVTKDIIVPSGLALVVNFTLKSVKTKPAVSHGLPDLGKTQSDSSNTVIHMAQQSTPLAPTSPQYMPGTCLPITFFDTQGKQLLLQLTFQAEYFNRPWR